MAADSQRVWTVLDLLNWTRDHFEKNNLDAPRLSAEMLLAHVLDCERIDLYARFDAPATEEQRETFRDLVRRAASHEPIAYLVGRKEFYSLSFKVTPAVLVPRPETELLVDHAAEHLRKLSRPGWVWDVATGSGCIALALASQVETATILATDLSEAALAVATENADTLGLADRVTLAQADLLTRPSQWTRAEPFDVITANLPYVGTDDPVGQGVDHEPAMALYAGADGLDLIRRFISQVPDQLATGGMLAMEFGMGQADGVRDLLVATGAFDEPEILRDLAGIERVAIAMKR
jgi:release factor glutamine methyltransferase